MLAIRRPCVFLLLLLSACARPEIRTDADIPNVVLRSAGTDELLIGLDVLSERVAWAAGTGGTFIRTADGGETWHAGSVPGADSLQFRDVHAISADAAILLSIGPGEASRVYETADRGASWSMVFRNDDAEAFYDCFDFWRDGTGLAFSDGVDGVFPIARTTDGGGWAPLPVGERPTALPGEGGFAASGTCLITFGEQTALIGTGNAAIARILRTDDRGATWTSAETPIVSGTGAGITTLAFRDESRGVALGGDLARSLDVQQNAAVTTDGGKTWRVASSPTFTGPVYGSTYVPDTRILVAVGPGGAAYSGDDASSWTPLDTLAYWSVDAAGPASVWAVGPDGRIAKFEFASDAR